MTNEATDILHQEPPRWVQRRAECRMDLKFAALRQIVERDVSDFNGLTEEQRGGRRFAFSANGEGTRPFFTVEEQGGDMRVSFQLGHNSIAVSGGGQAFTTSLFWNAAARTCKLQRRDNKEPFDVWEISQMALYPIFFPE